MYERVRLWTCPRLCAHVIEVYGRDADATTGLDVRVATCPEHYAPAGDMARSAWPDQQHYGAAIPDRHKRIFTCGFAVAYAPGYLDTPPVAVLRARDGHRAVAGLILGSRNDDRGVVIPHTPTGEHLDPLDVNETVDGPVYSAMQERLARAQHPLIGDDCPPAEAGDPPATDTPAEDATPGPPPEDVAAVHQQLTEAFRILHGGQQEHPDALTEPPDAAACLRCADVPCTCTTPLAPTDPPDDPMIRMLGESYARFAGDTRYGLLDCELHECPRPCIGCATSYRGAWLLPHPTDGTPGDPFWPSTWRPFVLSELDRTRQQFPPR